MPVSPLAKGKVSTTFTPTGHAKFCGIGALVWRVVSGKICGDKRAVEQREFILCAYVRFCFLRL